MTMSMGASLASRAGKTSAALPSRPMDSGLALVPGRDGAADGVVEVVGLLVEVAVLDPPGDPGLVAVHADGHAAVHRDGQRLRAAHAAEPGGQRDRAGQRAAEALGRDGGERLVGALQDALGADVDPRARGHLAVHGQAELLQAAELLPGRPLRDQVGVGDEHPRRPLVGAEHADRLAGLDEQGLVVVEVLQRRDDRRVGVPAPGGAAGAAVHDELVGVFGHLGVEVVHQHAHRALGGPALAAALGAAGGVDGFPALRHEPIMAGPKMQVTSRGSVARFGWPVRRVSVVGTSGAGKSTLARALAGALDADFLELDSVFHQARLGAAAAGRSSGGASRPRWRASAG